MQHKTTALLITAITLGTVLFKNQASNLSQRPLDKFEIMFNNWKKQHNRKYTSPAEHNYRKAVFIKNYFQIRIHNALNDNFKMGINKFADLTSPEFKTKYTGLRFTDEKKIARKVTLGQTPVPESVDWTKNGAVTGVKNQGQCGSCWAFSTTGSLEGFNKIVLGNTLTTFSEQQLVDCSRSYGNEGCNGGLMRSAFKYVHDKGLETEGDYPYKGEDLTCKYDAAKSTLKIGGFVPIPANDNDSLKAGVAKMPVAVAVDANILQFYFGGIVGKLCGHSLDHGVLAVGYSATTDGKKYWIVKNSWGHSWGEHGYFRVLRYEGVKKAPCGISMQASYPTK